MYSDNPLIPLPAAEAPPAAAPCSGCGPRKPRAAASLHDPQRPSTSRRLVDDAPGSARVALAHGLSSARIPAKPLLDEAFHSSFSARTT